MNTGPSALISPLLVQQVPDLDGTDIAQAWNEFTGTLPKDLRKRTMRYHGPSSE